MAFARSNDVDMLVVDLRFNGGGNNGLANNSNARPVIAARSSRP